MAECIAAELRPEIVAHGRAGERFHTVRELCDRFEATTHTVRAALKILEREGLIDVWPGSGVFVRPPQMLQQHVALVIAIGPAQPRLGYFHFRLIECLHQWFADRGVTARLYWARPAAHGADGALGEFQRAVARREVAGVVVVKGTLDPLWWTALQQCGRPVVGGDRRDCAYRVGLDYRELVGRAVKFLSDCGRRRLALLAWSPVAPPQAEIESTDLGAAFREAVRARGGQTREDWIRCDLYPTEAGAGYALFREVWMAGDEKPDALLVTDEVFVADVATAILEIGIRVPEDLLVVTHANKGAGTLYPFPTARLEYDPDEAVNVLGERLLRLLRREAVPEGVVNLSGQWAGVEQVERRLGATVAP